jgi:hypothetical protein
MPAEGINIHKAGKKSANGKYYTGTFYNDKGNLSGVSEGCLLIDNSKWDDFIDSFDDVKSVGVIVYRGISTAEALKYSYDFIKTTISAIDNTRVILPAARTVQRAVGLGGKNVINLVK